MGLLADQLIAYRSKTFAVNDRIVFALYDTEYYIPTSKIGIKIHNQIELLYSLDIDFSYCMLFTNHHGIAKPLQELCQTYRSNSLHVFENNFCTTQTDPYPINDAIHPNYINYKFSFLSNIRRDHRTYIRCYLEDRNLLDSSLVAWHPANREPKSRVFTPGLKPVSGRPDSCVFLRADPVLRVRDKIIPDSELQDLYNRNYICLENPVKHELITQFGNGAFKAEFLRYSLVNIAAETAFDYPYPYITEKTFKCFWHLVPFVIVGAAGSLAYLQSLGFKTFEQWWPEQYDTILNPTDRLKEIINVLDIISKWSLDECRKVYNDMRAVIKHNHDHYVNYYSKTLLNTTIESL